MRVRKPQELLEPWPLPRGDRGPVLKTRLKKLRRERRLPAHLIRLFDMAIEKDEERLEAQQ